MSRPVRALLAVLSVDVAATSVLVGLAARARRRPSATAYSRVAVVAVASLLPGMIAVGREVRAHGSAAAAPHRMRPTAMLFLGGLLVNTRARCSCSPRRDRSPPGGRPRGGRICSSWSAAT